MSARAGEIGVEQVIGVTGGGWPLRAILWTVNPSLFTLGIGILLLWYRSGGYGPNGRIALYNVNRPNPDIPIPDLADTPAPEQASLFSVSELRTIRYHVPDRVDPLAMGSAALQSWKQRVYHFQHQVQTTPAIAQGSLFDVALAGAEDDVADGANGTDAETIQPFTLPQKNTEFWRWKASDVGVSSLYFVIDYTLPLLLYVGETVKSNQRWKGEHDCKRYLLNYRQAHYQNQLPSQLGISFWANAPVQTRSRQQLESALILKWRSPFNKENWEFWGTPFVGGK